MWEAMKEIAPWLALGVVVVDRVFSAGKLASVLGRLADAVDKLADKVQDHDIQLAVHKEQIQSLRRDG